MNSSVIGFQTARSLVCVAGAITAVGVLAKSTLLINAGVIGITILACNILFELTPFMINRGSSLLINTQKLNDKKDGPVPFLLTKIEKAWILSGLAVAVGVIAKSTLLIKVGLIAIAFFSLYFLWERHVFAKSLSKAEYNLNNRNDASRPTLMRVQRAWKLYKNDVMHLQEVLALVKQKMNQLKQLLEDDLQDRYRFIVNDRLFKYPNQILVFIQVKEKDGGYPLLLSEHKMNIRLQAKPESVNLFAQLDCLLQNTLKDVAKDYEKLVAMPIEVTAVCCTIAKNPGEETFDVRHLDVKEFNRVYDSCTLQMIQSQPFPIFQHFTEELDQLLQGL